MSLINPISGAGSGLESAMQLTGPGKSVTGSGLLDPGKLAGSFLDAVNELQTQAGALQKSLYSDNPTELHQVMIAAQEAGTAVELLVEIRNKLIDAYQELMRMQI
jgi:flagellar hook-basal body complex protein FliE